MTYVLDEDGNSVSEDCMLHCTPVHVAECQAPVCSCGCHSDEYDPADAAERAAELDDRDDDTLASIARDMETERAPRLDEMAAERHGDLRRLQAERWRRPA